MQGTISKSIQRHSGVRGLWDWQARKYSWTIMFMKDLEAPYSRKLVGSYMSSETLTASKSMLKLTKK